MSKWDEFKNQQPVAKKEPALSIKLTDVCFSCQICNLDVEEADYYIADSILTWTCPEGHESHIEGFSLA